MGILLKKMDVIFTVVDRLTGFSGKKIIDSMGAPINPSFTSIKGRMSHRYYGDLDDNLSLNDLLSDRISEEIKYERAKKSLLDRVRNMLVHDDSFALEKIDIEKLGVDDLKDFILSYNLEAFVHDEITNDYLALKNIKNRLRAINGWIKIILNKVRKYGINLKEVFTRHHSFHFKNLDDYHSYILVARKQVSRV